jgi:hypothetical protein
MQMSLSSMGSGNLNLVAGGMQLPDIIKSSRVLVIKLKNGEKGQKAGEGKTENLGIETKGKDGFKMEVWEKSMRRLCWRYKEQSNFMRR